ncbi:MAG: Thioredoxin 1 [Candidatus Omnitrophica bacterium]|nr:Thioredoxin 1 [Candidatus Omnitrophota bacterium]
MAGAVQQITDATFEAEVTKSSIPVLVDFWAEWCGPCRLMIPVLDELAPAYQGKLKVAKINVDDNQDAPTRFGVMNIPTMIVFKSGQEVERIIGAVSKADLQRRLDRVLQS